MKLLACASYDYMKLMVVELQQQLAELEEAENAATNRNGFAGPNETGQVPEDQPRAPPRQRANPFSANESRRKNPARTWQSLHQEVGAKILSDRHVWCSKTQKNNSLIGQIMQ